MNLHPIEKSNFLPYIAAKCTAGGTGADSVTKEDEELAKKVSEMKIDTLTPKHLVKIQQFYKNLTESRSSKLYLLHR